MRVAVPALALVLALVAALVPAPLPAAAAPGSQRLVPGYVCPAEGATVERWAVFNPGEVAVPFTWALHASSQSGSASAAPGGYTFVTTSPIDGPAVLMVSVGGRLLRAVPATPACLTLAAAEAGTLRVRAVLAADEDPELDMPLEAGVVVRVDGEEVGTSDDTGVVEASMPPGTYDVEAVVPSLAEGAVTAEVHAGETTEVTVRLRSGSAVEEPGELELDEVVNGALSMATTSITLRFVRDGTHIPVSEVVEVELDTAAIESVPVDLTAHFSATAAGVITAHDLALVLARLSSLRSRATLRVRAADDRGFSYHESVSFVPGRFGVEVVLEGPPSRPDLPVEGITVDLRAGELVEEATTDAAGALWLPSMPAGPLHIAASTEFGGHVYSALADVSVSRDSRVRVVLLGIEDVLAGVRPWFIEAAFFATGSALSADPLQAAEREAAAGVASLESVEPMAAASTADSVSIFTVAGSQNVPVSASASLDVAEGTQTVTLGYEVSTAEYPFWVLQQSIYDDTWRLTVAAGNGSVLFTTGRNVNSQLYGAPVWSGAGRTGELQVELDVSGFTSAGATSVVISANATNIGDSILPTAVSATLGTDKTLTIDEISHDRATPTTGNHDHFSIPRPPGSPGEPPGSTNTFPRTFEVTFTRPDDVTITNVRAELLTGGGAVLDTVVDAAPGDPQVTPAGEAVNVRVTYVERQSPVGSTPPPADRIRYRFTLTGTDGSGATITSEPKESAPYFPLWRMPDGLDRFGGRDDGLDDWAARSTYQWLEANRALVTRINDVSGEHGRNIGHQTHATGRDIDMFHVYTLPGGAVSGGHNYQLLQAAARDALAGNAEQLAHLEAWAVATRDRFDALIGDPQVRRLYYAIGNAAGAAGTVRQLERGWARALLEEGTYTNPGGHTITLAAGAWANAGHQTTVFNAVHNSHFHVALR